MGGMGGPGMGSVYPAGVAPWEQDQKALFFNDRTGILFVRATLSDLDIIEQAIQILNVAPPQVEIEARFAEINQTDSKALGFDWLLGNTLIGGGRLGLSGGSAPSYTGQPSAANPGSISPVDGSQILPGVCSPEPVQRAWLRLGPTISWSPRDCAIRLPTAAKSRKFSA